MPAVLNARHETGPFDIIGDVHGCIVELNELLELLGYQLNYTESKGLNYGVEVRHPENRKLVFVGDLVDRGPDTPAVLKLVMSAVNAGNAYSVIGNHDDKLLRKLCGRNVHVQHGLAESLEQLKKEPAGFKEKVKQFLQSLPYYIWLQEGNLLVVHGGLPEEYHDKERKSLRAICIYGPTNGKTDEFGLPVRVNWAKDYSGKPFIAYGHTPVAQPKFENNTVNLDTGCVFGGKLTALLYPEMETVSVAAKKQYAIPRKPFI